MRHSASLLVFVALACSAAAPPSVLAQEMSEEPIVLPWYYLGNAFTLLASPVNPRPIPECKDVDTTVLATELIGMDQASRDMVLATERSKSGEAPGLLGLVRRISETPDYPWRAWDTRIQVKVRALSEEKTDLILRGTDLLIPWPLTSSPNPIDVGLEIPETELGKDDVFIDALFQVGHDLVKGPLRRRAESFMDDRGALRMLAEERLAQSFPYALPLPDRVEFEIRRELATSGTRLILSDDRVLLQLGWQIDDDFVWAVEESAPPSDGRFHPWPCGVFQTEGRP